MPELRDIAHNLAKPKVKPENMYPLILPEMHDTCSDKLVTIYVTSLSQACHKYDKLLTSLSTRPTLLRDVISCVRLYVSSCIRLLYYYPKLNNWKYQSIPFRFFTRAQKFKMVLVKILNDHKQFGFEKQKYDHHTGIALLTPSLNRDSRSLVELKFSSYEISFWLNFR